MINVKSRTHTVRYLAQSVIPSDLFRVVRYVGYRGDVKRLPWWLSVDMANSCRTDLTRTPDEWLADMKSNTRNEIRRAERDGCRFEVAEGVDEFVALYNAFAKEKGLNDVVTPARLKPYRDLLVTKAVRGGGETLVVHVNVMNREDGDAMLLFSCSSRLDDAADRQLIGRANRFLHFKDLQYMKEHGCRLYDWSGVCVDPDDPRYPIGKFKLSMGGTLVESPILKTPPYRLCEILRSGVACAKRLIKRRGE